MSAEIRYVKELHIVFNFNKSVCRLGTLSTEEGPPYITGIDDSMEIKK